MPAEELNQMQRKAPEPFKPGKSLVGKGGAFAPMPEQFLEVALESEPRAHLDPAERSQGNKRTGKGKKTIKRSTGSTFEIATPQDRQSTFAPRMVKKCETVA